ncbi:MAG: SpoIIE family protein phosphatase [Verrucomicrobium sp.]
MNSPVEMTLKDVSVLIAEDSPTQAMRLQFFLEKQGCRVTSAHNGKEALDRLKENQPALVITDINMPEMDGYELCRRIKDSPGYEKVPVILLTALSDPKDILRGLECGADNFVVKPYSEEFLLTRVKHVLANLELRQTSAGQVTEVYFAGQKYKINSGRTPSMDLLLSTYEMALQKNQELSRAKNRLEQQAGLLREKNAEMEADLEMARELQSAFLPRHYPVFPAAASPERSAIQFCHRYATTTELGGDFFDILRLSDTQAGIFICDVMGHGVRAALVTAIIRGLVEELGSAASDPGRFLTEINRSLCSILHQTVTPLFASAFYLVVDTAAASLEWANAGHPAPFHLRRSASETRRLEIIGQRPQPVLGLIDTITYPASRSSVEAGDLVMLFTDGLYELESAEGLYYDSELLMGATHQKAHLTTPALFDALLTELRHLSATGEFTDDMCLVGMDVTRTFSA